MQPREEQSLTIVISPHHNALHYWGSLWRYRELFYFLAWRDLLVRYKQTVLGITWGVIRPLLTVVVLTLVFGRIANLPSQGSAPYAVMVFAGLLPWQFFSTALNDASNSLVSNASMLTKVYFPRLIVPVSTIIVSMVDFLISLVILVGIMVWFRFVPSWQIVTLPFFFILALFSTVGSGVWLSALNVKYRDFRYIVPFIVQFGLYVTPVGFSSSIVPDKWRLIYSLNPLVGVIDGFRWAIIGGDLYLPSVLESVLVTALIVSLGITYFRKVERSFADII